MNDILTTVRARVDQHLKFFDILERIRWSFSTAFGVGASAAMFFAADAKTSTRREWVAILLVLGFSVAGLTTQVRILALVAVIWRRMLLLQEAEYAIVRDWPEVTGVSALELKKALSFPRLGLLESPVLRVLTAGMMSSFVFSLLVGIAVGIAADTLNVSIPVTVMLGLATTALFMVFSFIGFERYALALESLNPDLSGRPP